jgi:hypothetical protein
MIRKFAHKNVLVTLVLMVVVSLSLSSCETLRKKFTRNKKKNESSDFIPVLEPQEYPAPQNDPVKQYRQHYALIKAWHKELSSNVQEKVSDKKQTYTLNEIYNHISEMQKLVNTQTSAQLQKAAEQLNYYRDALQQPVPLRNITRIQSDLRAFHHMLVQLNVNKIKEDLAPATHEGID